MCLCFKTKPNNSESSKKDLTVEKTNLKNSSLLNEKRFIYNDVFNIFHNNDKLLSQYHQTDLTKKYNEELVQYIYRVDSLEYFHENKKIISDIIFTNQSINLVSLGGVIYNSLNYSYNLQNLKFIVINSDVYQIFMYFDFINDKNEIIKDSLILSFTNLDDVSTYKYILLEYSKNVLIKMPLFYETNNVYKSVNDLSYDSLLSELRTQLLEKVNKVLSTYSVDLDFDKLEYCCAYMHKNYYLNYSSYGYLIYNYEFLYYFTLESTVPEFYIYLNKIKRVRAWFSENLIEITKKGRNKIYFIQDGYNEFISKIWQALDNVKLKVDSLELDPKNSRVVNHYKYEDDYYYKLDFTSRKSYMINCIISMSRGYKLYFGNYFFFKFFASFYRNYILYNIVDKMAFRNPKVFSSAIDKTLTRRKTEAIMSYKSKDLKVNYTLVNKHSIFLEINDDLYKYAERTKHFKQLELERRRKEEEERLLREQEEKRRIAEEQERKRIAEEERLKAEEEQKLLRLQMEEQKKQEEITRQNELNKVKEEEERKRRQTELDKLEEESKRLEEEIENGQVKEQEYQVEEQADKPQVELEKEKEVIEVEEKKTIEPNQVAQEPVETIETGNETTYVVEGGDTQQAINKENVEESHKEIENRIDIEGKTDDANIDYKIDE